MAVEKGKAFLQGLAAGALGVLLVGLLLLPALGEIQELVSLVAQRLRFEDTILWAYQNLGFSIPVFGLILILFFHSLRQLQQRLHANGPLEEVAQAEHLVDTWTSLFFGVGVIWTAIGMRSALLNALGEPAAVAEAGGFTVLQRMVDGGILLALSTTIFGGIGGYLMRIVKTLAVGAQLKGYYEEAARSQGAAIHEQLAAIKARLEILVKSTRAPKATTHEQTTLGTQYTDCSF